MSAWFRDDNCPLLLEETVRIAMDFLERSGQIDDPMETSRFLVEKVKAMIDRGQRNRLLLANRAINAFQQYRRSRTIEVSRFAG